MTSDLDGSLGSRYFLSTVNEMAFFASYTYAFEGFWLITCLVCTPD